MAENILMVRANDEQMALFEDGEGTKYDMDLWTVERIRGNVWQIAFESPVRFEEHGVVPLRTVARRLLVRDVA